MIVEDADSWAAARAAWALGARPSPAWLVMAGDGDLELVREVVASDPVRVVRGHDLAALEGAWREARSAWAAGAGVPVAMGFLSYDLGRRFERLRGIPPAPSGWPEMEMRFYDALWIRDARDGRCQVWASSADAAARLRARLQQGDEGGIVASAGARVRLGPFVDPRSESDHAAAVLRVLDYIRAGDVYQVNLARRLEARDETDGPPGLALAARLQAESPAPHAIWLGGVDGEGAVVGNSPERFLCLRSDRRIETRPIKGTRPRGDDPAADAALLAELRADAKDAAEHAMIVDLERNDLGRVCEVGSVSAADVARPLSLPTVHHLVSTVTGRLRPGVDLPSLLRATFPGGSITGAPKIRAMEVIDELEPAQRGPYTGATGWLGAAGDLDLAVAIRTALVRPGHVSLWVGGGIVADSDPARELEETTAKARAFARLCQHGAGDPRL